MMTISSNAAIKRGHGSEERPLATALWERDTYPGYPAQIEKGNYDPTLATIDFKRYYDRDHAQAEHEKLWMKSWVLACRDEDIATIGDRVPVQIGPVSFFVIRTGEDEFKAFWNSCTHRGTQLCADRESGKTIVCPFHAWEWRLNGTLSHIPSHWDFKAVTPKNGALREVRIGRWGGFIYINADSNPGDFIETLGVIPRHFEQFDLANRYTAAHFRKKVHANWKLTQEAFMESYHVVGTHPNAIPFSGDTQTQYDIFEEGPAHIGRQLTPAGLPSMHAAADASMIAAAMAAAVVIRGMHYPDADLPVIDPSSPARPQLAQWFRDLETERLGRECSLPDGIMLDSALYFAFPQSTFWLSESLCFSYCFLPDPADPETSYMEVRMLKHWPQGQPRPRPADRIDVAPHETVDARAPAFGFLGSVFDQDYTNLPRVQAGVRSADPERHYAQLGDYQEFVIKRFHEVLDAMLAA